MNTEELITYYNEQKARLGYLEFEQSTFNHLTEGDIETITSNFGSVTIMKLPESEIAFFDWLKENDMKIWEDLWAGDDLFEPYFVSIGLLPKIKDNARGFPICDLENNDNFYFTSEHLPDKETKILIESVQSMYMEKKPLNVEQTLVLEISIKPIDIWRFSYRYGINLERAKQAVQNLVEEGVLIHLKEAAHLANFIDF